MTTLSKSDRNALDKAVQKAREISEEGARKALISLGVSDEKKPGHLNDEQAELRRRVRVVLRRLGTEAELIRSVAYEQWHRMLFARFLIENDLLIHPEHQVSVNFEGLVELAHDEQIDPWELAARYASAMLPGIFKQDDPLLKITYAPEDRNALCDILAQIPGDTFRTSDALGWTYQFWQTKKKDEVNKSGVKIGAAELPSQTQLFTEPYMVHFLLDNSLGAWWAGKRLTEEDLKTATSEEELRQKASLPGVPLTYLRFVQDEHGIWTPAAGSFSEWPDQVSELKMLDPCCGSGHFLVATLLMLVPMRMEMEGLSARKAVDAVLSENLHGLEIDERCVEIAAFALALAAWTYP
ncbi:DNA methyltransferase, partial [Methanospirillum sp.]|uniref:DNA methyltransferase n=1 Tax=Methanospirillum sp. TaxID=45200 RepID=UPI002CD32400